MHSIWKTVKIAGSMIAVWMTTKNQLCFASIDRLDKKSGERDWAF